MGSDWARSAIAGDFQEAAAGRAHRFNSVMGEADQLPGESPLNLQCCLTWRGPIRALQFTFESE
jgi:hypothetical protein